MANETVIPAVEMTDEEKEKLIAEIDKMRPVVFWILSRWVQKFGEKSVGGQNMDYNTQIDGKEFAVACDVIGSSDAFFPEKFFVGELINSRFMEKYVVVSREGVSQFPRSAFTLGEILNFFQNIVEEDGQKFPGKKGKPVSDIADISDELRKTIDLVGSQVPTQSKIR